MIKTNDRNLKLAEIIAENPGIQFREIMRISGMKNGVLSHYLGKLEKNGTIKALREPRQTRFYPSHITDKESIIIKALRRQTPRDILLSLILNDGLHFSEIVNNVKKSPATVSLYLSQLVDDKLILVKISNLKKRYYIKDREIIDKLIEDYRPTSVEQPSSNFEDIINSL